jgi:hypothetical protein
MDPTVLGTAALCRSVTVLAVVALVVTAWVRR